MADNKEKTSGKSLSEFVEEIQRDIKEFQKDYLKHHNENPEHYPLEIPSNNEGLWFEFFIDFCSGTD